MSESDLAFDPLVDARDAGPVRVLTLNRPDRLNSFNAALHGALRAALDAAAAEPAVRCVVLTGAGRGFCAGQDLNDPALGADADPGEMVERLYTPLALRVRSMPVPMIAAVNGVAAGAGANLALGCDIVLAARSASFIQAFAKIGLVPDCGGTWLLPRLVGRARALALAMTGDKLTADEAERLGLIWRAVDDAALMAETLALAARLAALPVKALAATRRAFDEASELGFEAALSLEARWQGQLGRSADAREGIAAFTARREPVFTDR